MSFAATWMDLEMIKLSEVSQKKTNAIFYHLYVVSKPVLIYLLEQEFCIELDVERMTVLYKKKK